MAQGNSSSMRPRGSKKLDTLHRMGCAFSALTEEATARKKLADWAKTVQSRGSESSGGGTGHTEIKKVSGWEALEVVIVSNGS